MSNQLQPQQDPFEPIAKILAANALAQSLSYCMERKYLASIDNGTCNLSCKNSTEGHHSPFWIKIEQVGKPLKDSAEDCFTAIQKILTSCFLPNETQLLFLLHSENGVCHLYIGVRPVNSRTIKDDFTENLNNFIKGLWPGLKSREVSNNELKLIKEKIDTKNEGKYRCFKSITGIPSMESQYKTLYPATIDKLIAGMQQKNFTYLVVADPIEEKHIDSDRKSVV